MRRDRAKRLALIRSRGGEPRWPASEGLEPARERVGGKRLTQHISLDDIATHVTQRFQGGLILHALSDRTEVEVVGDINDRLHEPPVSKRSIHVAHEGPVGLEFVQW